MHLYLNTVILKGLVKQAIKIILNARSTATKLHTKQNFKVNSKEFLSKSTGIPHVQMIYIPISLQ